MCNSAMDDVTQVTVVSIASSAVLLWWSDDASHVPMRTLLIVMIMTLVSILLVIDRIRYCCPIQHRMESLNVCVDLFIIFGEMGVI
jgi:hypothetical protein